MSHLVEVGWVAAQSNKGQVICICLFSIPVVLTGGDFVHDGILEYVWRYFQLSHQRSQFFYWCQTKARDAAQHATMQRAVSMIKNLPSLKRQEVQVEKLCGQLKYITDNTLLPSGLLFQKLGLSEILRQIDQSWGKLACPNMSDSRNLVCVITFGLLNTVEINGRPGVKRKLLGRMISLNFHN